MAVSGLVENKNGRNKAIAGPVDGKDPQHDAGDPFSKYNELAQYSCSPLLIAALQEERATSKKKNWDDSTECPWYICGFCPHELFSNTRQDLGETFLRSKPVDFNLLPFFS